jgi:hypothetical protein
MYYRSLLIWFLIMLAESVHGFLRGIWLTPLVGDFTARQISVFNGALLIFIITWIFIRWMNLKTKRSLLIAGTIWVLLTVIFEISLGKGVFQMSWERILSDYNLIEGGLMPVGLVLMLLSPLGAAKLKGML